MNSADNSQRPSIADWLRTAGEMSKNIGVPPMRRSLSKNEQQATLNKKNPGKATQGPKTPR